MNTFEAQGFKKSFGAVTALKNANFSFEGPKICGLVGANGSGKTTFARLCSGLIKKDEGNLVIDGQQADINSPKDAKKFGIVLAHQNLSLIPDLTVWENISLGNEKKSWKAFLDNKEAKDRAHEMLESLIPGEIAIDAKTAVLSPAQKQMVEVAKALSQKPKMLILDEPTAALEYYHVEQLFEKVMELKENKVSVIFISHRLWEITRICDMVIAFRNGETVGTVDFESEERSEKLIIPLVAGDEGCAIDFEKKKVRDLSDTETAIHLKDIYYRDVLKNVSMSVKRGEVLGIGGLHGQGQEELIMLMAGDLSPSRGKIMLGKRSVKAKHPRDTIRNGTYLVPGDRLEEGLLTKHDIFANVIFPRFCLKKDGLVLNFKKLIGITHNIIQKTEIAPPDPKMIVNNLSGGNQQKVVFGRWLQFLPKVLLLNDPAKGIDIQAKDTLYKLVHELADQGTAVVLYASSNEELICNCDRVLIMFEGEIAEEISHDDLSDENLVRSSLRVEAV
ncbi:MAG: sugar ABC transporter ATP-binding protein [Desulfobacterales bacterium]|jgi:ribose transport system ATP-binding protein